MKLQSFNSSAGEPIDGLHELQRLAENNEKVNCAEFRCDANSLYSAVQSFGTLDIKLVNRNHIHRENIWAHEVLHEGGSTLIGRICLSNLDKVLPTQIEEVICHFLLQGRTYEELKEATLLFNSQIVPPGKAFNFLLIACQSSGTSAASQKSISLYSPSDYVYPPAVDKLLAQAYDLSYTKYGVLELYRVLETLFLKNILDAIIESFFLDPKASLEKAQKSILRERAQLAIFIQRARQEAHARNFAFEINKLLTQGNSFAAALREKFVRDKEQNFISDFDSWAGCWYIYQIRCAIAHAGTDSIVFEYFDDSEDLIFSLFECLERIALGAVGIDFN